MGEPLCDGRAAGPSEGAGGAEADIVEQHDQDIGRASRRPQGRDGLEPRPGVLRVLVDRAVVDGVRDGEDRPIVH